MPSEYVEIYKLRLPFLNDETPRPVFETNEVMVHIISKALKFTTPNSETTYFKHGVSLKLIKMSISLPKATYLVIINKVPRSSETDLDAYRTKAKLRSSVIVSYFDLEYNNLIEKKVHEGFILLGEDTFVLSEEKPIKLYAREYPSIGKIKEKINKINENAIKLSTEDSERFQLASRWFRRGYETDNYIDNLLFWTITLEIFPCKGNMKFVNNVSSYLANVYKKNEANKRMIKKKLKLKEIYKLRSKIVHAGKIYLNKEEEESISNYLEILENICVVCLRTLIGLPPGKYLDQYLLVK